ncbi:MAG: hypothetical protein MJ148_03285, partial [Clostridia bacterium]|nr:hypothetical protein [Clostridia bacterium]
MILESSPPDATLASGLSSSPLFAEIKNSIISVPFSVGRLSVNLTSKIAFLKLSSSSSLLIFIESSPAAAYLFSERAKAP